MERINETNILELNHINDKNEFQDLKDEESEKEIASLEEKEMKDNHQAYQSRKAGEEDKKTKIRTNLEFLLSQNDILPLIKKINKENLKNPGGVSLNKYIKKPEKKISATNVKNARLMNKNIENDFTLSDSEEDNSFVKLEEQPESLKNGFLKEYQMEALNWLLKLHYMGINSILADEMGLGKTVQTIALLAYLQQQKKEKEDIIYIVIVPKVTINNWLKEINKWLPSMRVLFFYGNKDERRHLVDVELKKRNFDLILTTFECSMKEKTALSKFNYEYLIIDEAHRMKNEKAKFSIGVRQFKSVHRLLLTGTPLQNNLHELWALLNFLMPAIFNDSEEFDKIFDLSTANEEDQQIIVKQIHRILKPFVLRRLKSEVEFKLPPKKEIYLYVGLSELQKLMYKQILTKNIDLLNGVTKDKIQLLNIIMQLKKVCNHPYLFPKVEKGPPYIEGDHLIYNSMKMKILDVLLKKIKSEDGKVLIFSQMTTLLNILDDYCRYRGYSYCRIDGSTSSEDREKRIEDFQSPNSDKFIFLLSTRAGGLGINLHAANVVILYDSDWNPQVDLQAIDRAHRIGQLKPVTVYRFVTEGTVEEKIIERAAKKLKIDHLIIQRGKQIQNKVSALEMTNFIRHGVDRLLNLNEETSEKDIEEILEYSINKTEQINTHLKSLEEKLNINNLSLSSDSKDIYQFEGEDYKKKQNEENANGQLLVNFSLSFGQRERKLINSNLEDKSKKQDYKKPRQLSGWRARIGGGYAHQFYDVATLDYLESKEAASKYYKKNKSAGINTNEEEPLEEFTLEDEQYREELLQQGFSKWNKKDFTKFVRASEFYGLNDHENISKMMRTKTPAEIEEYVKVFQTRYEEIPGGHRILAKINKSENEKNKIIEYHSILDQLFDELSGSNENIYESIKIPYKIKGKPNQDLYEKYFYLNRFNEEEDKYFMCLMFKYGYRSWSLIRTHIMNDPMMKFNLSMKVKTDQEFLDRANYLINCFKQEMNNKNKIKRASKSEKNKKQKKKLSKKKKKIKKRRI